MANPLGGREMINPLGGREMINPLGGREMINPHVRAYLEMTAHQSI